jgi:hypothetical protein
LPKNAAAQRGHVQNRWDEISSPGKIDGKIDGNMMRKWMEDYGKAIGHDGHHGYIYMIGNDG